MATPAIDLTSASLDVIERQIEDFVENNKRHCAQILGVRKGNLLVLKYMPANRLSGALSRQMLYASKEPGYTWGDAVYVAPLRTPLSNMMYGDVAVIGKADFENMRVFDATEPHGILYYQQWIRHHTRLYRRLTTTIHADSANHELRNNFRTRFQIDCVCFRPDEECLGYASAADTWLALTKWGSTRKVCFGPTSSVKEIEWCAISTEAFEQERLGYKAVLHPDQTGGRNFVFRKQKRVADALRSAYRTKNQVVIIGF